MSEVLHSSEQVFESLARTRLDLDKTTADYSVAYDESKRLRSALVWAMKHVNRDKAIPQKHRRTIREAREAELKAVNNR